MDRLLLDDVLATVAQNPAVEDMAVVLGACRATVWRKLQRAELAELVKRTRVGKLDVWELTEDGERRVAGRPKGLRADGR